jgi:type IV secretion system protein VirB2
MHYNAATAKRWTAWGLASLSALALAPSQAMAQVYSAGSPAGSGPIVAAVNWVQGTLLGNVATAVAVIAIAVVGFMMLTGRMNWKHGITVILGCFILFGASVIVAGIRGAAQLAG